MNWTQIRTVLWLRWRLTRNQWSRGGQLNAVLTMIASPPAQGEARRAPPPLSRMALPLANPAFRWLAAVFLLGGIASAIPATLVLFYVEDVLRRPELAGAFLAAYFGAGAAGLPVWTGLSRRIGKARAWIVGMVLAVLAFLWAFALGPGDATPFLAICVLSGLALGADLTLAPSLLADVIDRDEAGGHGRHEGAYFGLWSLATKASLALAAGIALPLLDALGYAPGRTQHAFVLAAVYALVPCALKAAAAGLLWRSPLMQEPNR
jgi:Na+/melibiose symporter-like transporter